MTVVVLDDSDMVRNIIRRGLKEEHNVVSLRDGKTLVDNIKVLNPGAIILDILLQEELGTDILKTLREKTNAPVILYSSVGRERECVKEALMLPNVFHLSKPAPMEDLKKMLTLCGKIQWT